MICFLFVNRRPARFHVRIASPSGSRPKGLLIAWVGFLGMACAPGRREIMKRDSKGIMCLCFWGVVFGAFDVSWGRSSMLQFSGFVRVCVGFLLLAAQEPIKVLGARKRGRRGGRDHL